MVSSYGRMWKVIVLIGTLTFCSGCVPTRANQVAGVYQGKSYNWVVRLELRPNMTYTETLSHKGAPDVTSSDNWRLSGYCVYVDNFLLPEASVPVGIFDVQKRWPASSNGTYRFDWCLSMEPSLRDGWTLVINPDTDSALTKHQ